MRDSKPRAEQSGRRFVRGEAAVGPKRVLFVFAWLVVGGEETEVRLLAQNLDPERYRIEVVACFRKPNMPEQTHEQLRHLGIPVDTTPYNLSFDDTVRYLKGKLPAYEVVVACQAVRDVYPAMELLGPDQRPPLIEHGGLVEEATAGPKHMTDRYIGVCKQIRDAGASVMQGRTQDAIEIPSMVDLNEFDKQDRAPVRAELGVADGTPLIGWVGRLDRKKRVEDFVRAAAIVREKHPDARFLVVGGPDAFMPEYADELKQLAAKLGLQRSLAFLGDRPDVNRLLAAMDIFVWLSRGEGMPHVISEAGAAGLPVIATRDNGTEEQLTDGETGIFVEHESPSVVADAIASLIESPAKRHMLGSALRAKVEQQYNAQVLTQAWQALFDEVIAEKQARITQQS